MTSHQVCVERKGNFILVYPLAVEGVTVRLESINKIIFEKKTLRRGHFVATKRLHMSFLFKSGLVAAGLSEPVTESSSLMGKTGPWSPSEGHKLRVLAVRLMEPRTKEDSRFILESLCLTFLYFPSLFLLD